jgi:DNA adenine methylase
VQTETTATLEAPRPFLKWAGGKRWLVEKHARLLPAAPRGYREPFLGGGAVFFLRYAETRPAVLSDVNPRLVDAYVAVRDHVEEVIAELADHPYEEGHYYDVRARFNRHRDGDIVKRAAWLIYLNKTCVNGLYRENRDGEFNTSFGRYDNPTICDAANLRACSRALRGVEIRRADFDEALADVREGEVVFLDPPYVPVGGTASFVGYTAGGFSSGAAPAQGGLFAPAPLTDQQRLAATLDRLDHLGARWVLTNSDTPEARALYARWHVEGVQAARSINSAAEKRGPVGELVVTNRRPS